MVPRTRRRFIESEAAVSPSNEDATDRSPARGQSLYESRADRGWRALNHVQSRAAFLFWVAGAIAKAPARPVRHRSSDLCDESRIRPSDHVDRPLHFTGRD